MNRSDERSPGKDRASEAESNVTEPPIPDLFRFDEDQVNFISAESFPASDPPPPQSGWSSVWPPLQS